MATLAALSPQPLLPGLFHAAERRAHWTGLDPSSRLVLAAQTLCTALDTMARDARSHPLDQAIVRDRRFRLAMSIALPLSLGGRVRRLESFRTLAALASKAARENGVTGPAGLALQAAKLLTEAVLGPPVSATEKLHLAMDAAIDAAVAHGALHDRDPAQIRARAEIQGCGRARPRPH